MDLNFMKNLTNFVTQYTLDWNFSETSNSFSHLSACGNKSADNIPFVQYSALIFMTLSTKFRGNDFKFALKHRIFVLKSFND